MPNNICPTEEVHNFMQSVGVAAGMGNYQIRRQHEIRGDLFISTAKSDTEEGARKLFETPQEGLTFAVIVGPKGEVVETFGCPIKKDPKGESTAPIWKKWWFWALVVSLAAAGTVGVVLYMRKHKTTTS